MIMPLERGRYDWPWRGGPSFITPDGSQVVLRGPALDVSRPWSGGFVGLVRGARRTFTVAEAGAFDWHNTYTTIPDQVTSQPYRGGELIVAIRHQRDDAAPDYRAAWRGRWFELHTRASGPADGILAIFDAFQLTDTPLGLLARPRSTRQAQLEPLRVAKQIPGIGQLTIERPGASQVAIPDFRGYLTQHGELWRQPLGSGAQGRSRPDALVLATPTAITRLVPGPSDTADPNEAIGLLTGLDVRWEPL
ncbi:MAG: hypothetical protein ACRDRU_19855 [Pseudonocardiaceae bacterium]